MGRKHKNARAPRLLIRPNSHLMYSTDELYQDATVVRYMGEQDDDCIKVWHPDGFELWVHITHVWFPSKQAA